MKKIEYETLAPIFVDRISKGALLNVQNDFESNLMTVSWATIGNVWNMPLITVYVRYSRFTYKMMEAAQCFTLSLHKDDSMKDVIAYCGNHSGRKVNKAKECNLTLVPASTIQGVCVEEFDINIECEVIYQQAMEPSNIDYELDDRFYKDNDYHVIYYGKIKNITQKD